MGKCNSCRGSAVSALHSIGISTLEAFKLAGHLATEEQKVEEIQHDLSASGMSLKAELKEKLTRMKSSGTPLTSCNGITKEKDAGQQETLKLTQDWFLHREEAGQWFDLKADHLSDDLLRAGLSPAGELTKGEKGNSRSKCKIYHHLLKGEGKG